MSTFTDESLESPAFQDTLQSDFEAQERVSWRLRLSVGVPAVVDNAFAKNSGDADQLFLANELTVLITPGIRTYLGLEASKIDPSHLTPTAKRESVLTYETFLDLSLSAISAFSENLARGLKGVWSASDVELTVEQVNHGIF